MSDLLAVCALRIVTEVTKNNAALLLAQLSSIRDDIATASPVDIYVLSECLSMINRNGLQTNGRKAPVIQILMNTERWWKIWNHCDKDRVARILGVKGYLVTINSDANSFHFEFSPIALHGATTCVDWDIEKELRVLSEVTHHKGGLSLSNSILKLQRLILATINATGADLELLASVLRCIDHQIIVSDDILKKTCGLRRDYSYEFVDFLRVSVLVECRGYIVEYFDTEIVTIWLFDNPMDKIVVVLFSEKVIFKVISNSAATKGRGLSNTH